MPWKRSSAARRSLRLHGPATQFARRQAGDRTPPPSLGRGLARDCHKLNNGQYKADLTSNNLKNADLRSGRLVFSKTCQQCHKLYGEGGAIGPDLTGTNRLNIDYLLSNIIDPVAEVAKDYRMSIVETQNGRKVTGIIVERTAARLVVQTATERITISAEDVEEGQNADISIMPEGQLDALTKKQVRRSNCIFGGEGAGGDAGCYRGEEGVGLGSNFFEKAWSKGDLVKFYGANLQIIIQMR